MKFIVIVLLVVSFSANAELRKWNKKMQELSKTLSEVMPDLARNTTTPDAKKRLENNSKKLSELVHSLQMRPGGESILPPDADPTVTMISDMFLREVKRAHQSFKAGHTEYGKAILRTAANYCIACHSRNNTGPDFPTLNLSTDTSKLSKLEKAQLLAATRHFDGALAEYTALAGDKEYAKTKPFEWHRAVKQGLSVAVRVKQEPEKAMAVIDAATVAAGADFISEQAGAWKDSVTKWKKEGANTKDSEEELYKEAQRLFNEGKSLQKYPLDHSGDVYYLRATAMVHQLLNKAPNGKNSSDALLIAGTAYEILSDPTLWPIHEIYYESCIRRSPHTQIAKDCFHKYEETIYFGYSGSGGFSLPDDVRTLLNELRTLAKAGK